MRHPVRETRHHRFDGTAWLPILHSFRDGWHFTALFSNTDRAHELGRVRDWVVIYVERDGHEGQCTGAVLFAFCFASIVVTAVRRALAVWTY